MNFPKMFVKFNYQYNVICNVCISISNKVSKEFKYIYSVFRPIYNTFLWKYWLRAIIRIYCLKPIKKNGISSHECKNK